MAEEENEILTLAVLRVEVSQLRAEMTSLDTSTRELVEAWRAAGKVVAFIKMLASVATAVGAAWLGVKHFFGGGG